ncbi:MAG: putative zinc-binding metallopeptidase [Longimicrobiales bacterium]
MATPDDLWDSERRELLGRRIADLDLRIQGSRVEALVERLYAELESRGLVFRPPVYLSDEWGCPEGVPLIGVPFFLADDRLERLEREFAVTLEEEGEPIRIMRHEAGHAFNYAYRLYDRPEWRQIFGPYSRPYRDQFRVDPFSREYVRHILGWYAQKHPDEDFAESFAVWLTPDLDWRRRYAGWPALRKLEYVERVMTEVGSEQPRVAAALVPEHLPVDAMNYTLEEHYRAWDRALPLEDPTHFDGDLRNIFIEAGGGGGGGEAAAEFIRSHRRELVGRIAYWTGETSSAVREFVDHLARRAAELDLRVAGLEASTLIELTAFGTAVIMNYRHTDAVQHSGSATDARS